MSKTLYISDLDGTLLTSSERISDSTCDILNNLVDKGLVFSYATARSVHTASKVTAGLTAKIPLIVYNGAFIVDNITKERIATNTFTDSEAEEIYFAFIQGGAYPIVYALIDDTEKFSYIDNTLSKELRSFVDSRKNDFRNNPLTDDSTILNGIKYYFTCIDDEQKLTPIYNRLKGKFNCVYQQDFYSGEQWLEVMPHSATKANAILQLKKLLGCDKVVSFGDGINDIPMFKISDECYAVSNACEELKSLATGIIDSCNDDGVARWILNDYI